MVKTKKNIKEIAGNSVEQRIKDTTFYRDFQTWKELPHVGFLYRHGVKASRTLDRRGGNSIDVSQGHQKYLPKLTEILEMDEFVGDIEIAYLEKYLAFIDESKGTEYDPAKLPYHEKVYLKDGTWKRKRPVWGHFATPSFMKKNPDYRGEAAKEGEYTYNENELAQNAPHRALFSENNPKGLKYILEDAIKELGDAELDIIIRKVPNPSDLFKLPQLKEFFESKLNGTYFKQGKIQAATIRNDLKGQVFTVANEQEETLVRELAKVPRAEVAGDIKEFTVDVSPTVIERVYLASNKSKAGGFYIHGKTLDKRPRKEGVPVAKSWEDWLRVDKSPIAMFNRLAENLKQEVRNLVNTGMSLNDAVVRVHTKMSNKPKSETKPKPFAGPNRPTPMRGQQDNTDMRSRWN